MVRYHIEGLTPDGNRIRYDAYIALAAAKGVSYSSYHPIIPNLTCVDIDVRPLANSQGQCIAIVTYEPASKSPIGAGAYKVTISGSNGSKTLHFDDEGVLLTVDYKDTNDANAVKSHAYAPIIVPSPNLIFQFEWRQTNSPLGQATYYRRKLNSTPWQGLDKHTVICREFGGTLNQAQGRVWDCVGIFEWDKGLGNGLNGWLQPQIYIDANTGRVPGDITPGDDGITRGVTSGNGWKLTNPFDEADFNPLGFPDLTI